MNQQQYYLGQGPWFEIKEYLGLFTHKYAYSQFINLELEVLEEIYENITNIKCRGNIKPAPYMYQWWDWGDSIKPLGRRTYELEMSEIYYEKNHPDIIASMKAINEQIAKDENLKGRLVVPRIKNIHTNPIKHDLEREVLTKSTAKAVKVYNKFSVQMKKVILTSCRNHPLRRKIYAAMDQAVRLGKRKCLCGCIVATKTKAFYNHLKTNKHVKELVLHSNLIAIEEWYKHTKIAPPGFTCDNKLWSHIIPEDPKRLNSHPATHTDSFDLCQYISTKPLGRGHEIIRPI